MEQGRFGREQEGLGFQSRTDQVGSWKIVFTLTEESKYVSIAGKREATPFTQAPELVGIISKSPEIFKAL